jgi:RNA polymerase sigma factor (sigma-70 family)
MDEDELDLWKRYRQGDETALEDLVIFYLPLVKFWVYRISIYATWANRDDLMQDGTIGLIKACEKFDIDRGYKFSTFARYYIREAIFNSTELTRNLTRRQDENSRKVKQAHDELVRELELKPSLEEIAVRAGLSIEQVQAALNARSIAFADDSIVADAPSRSGNKTVERQDTKILIREALQKLNKLERAIIARHYWAGHSDAEIGDGLGLSEDHARKIRQRAIIKLRTLLGVEKRK